MADFRDDFTSDGKLDPAGRGMRQRPAYHITAPSNWLNDPNGPVHFGGRYHLFYQYNPLAPLWGRPHWGHVSSSDLVRWVDHPVALTPSEDGPDRDGCWSGCLRVIDGRPTIFYTGVAGEGDERIEAVCRADGTEDLDTWDPRPEALIDRPPAEIQTGHHRDPYLFKDGDRWRMLLGSSLRDGSGRAGAVLLYESDDLDAWTYRGVLYQRPAGQPPIDTGPLWECPHLLRQGDSDVLVFSVQMEGEPHPLRYAVYAQGRLQGEEFDADSLGLVDHGDAFYAPALARDARGRDLMWGWIQELDDDDRADHAGVLSLPRIIEITNGRVTVRPVEEVKDLRTHAHPAGDVSPAMLRDGHAMPTPRRSFEFVSTVRGSGTASLGFSDSSGVPAGAVEVDLVQQELRVTGRGRSALTVGFGDTSTPEDVELRVFVDGSVIEVFVNDELSLTTRNSDVDGRSVRLGMAGGQPSFCGTVVYELDVAFPDRR